MSKHIVVHEILASTVVRAGCTKVHVVEAWYRSGHGSDDPANRDYVIHTEESTDSKSAWWGMRDWLDRPGMVLSAGAQNRLAVRCGDATAIPIDHPAMEAQEEVNYWEILPR